MYFLVYYIFCVNIIKKKQKKQLNDFDFDMIDNSNLSRAYLNGTGLHLNTKGLIQFAKNLIESILKL